MNQFFFKSLIKKAVLLIGYTLIGQTRALWPLLFIISGCEVGYYAHLAQGQLHLMSQRQPIQAVIIDETTPPELQQRLLLTQSALQFAQTHLHLTLDGQYSHYIALTRPYALWSLAAAPRLSFEPYQWCYPMIGCANYRGYFNLKRAKKDEDTLKNNGYETYIRGVSAYSTLGWFADPLLSSFAHYPDADFIELIFHELAHSKLYVKNNTEFNESFATFVGQQGLKAFKKLQLLPQSTAQNTPNNDFKLFKNLILKYKKRLHIIYTSDMDDQQKAVEKKKTMATLQQEYQHQKQYWSQPNTYDKWINTMNNAQMLVFGDYENMVPLFKDIFITCQQDWVCFYKESEAKALDK